MLVVGRMYYLCLEYIYICVLLLLLPLSRHLVRRPQHLPHDPHALPVFRRAPIHAAVFAHVQVAVLELLVYALLVARPHHPAAAKRRRDEKRRVSTRVHHPSCM